MTIYLYVKTHRKTGLKYLGKTSREDYHDYPGSGLVWKRHLRKHGHDYNTDILLKTDSIEEARETGLFFSRLFDVVESKDWANLTVEDANGGENLRGLERTEDWKRKISESRMGENNPAYKHGRYINARNRPKKDRSKYGMSGLSHKESTKEKQRQASKGNKNTKGRIWINNGKERRMIPKDQTIPEGWRLGRSL